VTPAPIVLPAPLVWRQSPNVSSRRGQAVELVVIHETAGSYRGAVSWLCNPASDASAHFVIREDGAECSQLVRLADKAWTQGNQNPRCVSIELANITAKGFHNERQLRVAARIAGWLCLKYGLPPRWARAGVGRGLAYHGNLPNSGSHPFCGPDAAGWARFVEYVGDELERGGYRKAWAR
jgi:hypothetical protein